jgi:hypothetical protein
VRGWRERERELVSERGREGERERDREGEGEREKKRGKDRERDSRKESARGKNTHAHTLEHALGQAENDACELLKRGGALVVHAQRGVEAIEGAVYVLEKALRGV